MELFNRCHHWRLTSDAVVFFTVKENYAILRGRIEGALFHLLEIMMYFVIV